MTPWLDDGDITLYHGDALETLREMPTGSVDMVATSPPFYGLRDYGTDGQIGLEETPQQWVDNLVSVFRECRRVLADHGTLWVEIGDSYGTGSGPPSASSTLLGNGHIGGGPQLKNLGRVAAATSPTKPKDLLGQPWLLAFALRADGWYLRSEIIWARPNPMPESVTDRPTKSHSTVFLLSKQPRYFYDADAIREAFQASTLERSYTAAKANHAAPKNDGDPMARKATGWEMPSVGANARSVWTIPTQPTPYAHFATWPQKLVARMIQAGTSEKGRCPVCGAPWTRDVERELMEIDRSGISPYDHHSTRASGRMVKPPTSRTVGWQPTCDHGNKSYNTRYERYPLSPVPCTVLDPFAGSGTTLLVARHHQRHAIGIELNADYCAIAATQLQQLSLLT